MKRSNWLLLSRCLIIAILLPIFQSNAQSKISCDSLMKKKYKMSDLEDKQQFLDEVKAAILCKYDSLDMHIFMGPSGNTPLSITGTLLVKRAGTANEGLVSMAEIIEPISSIRQMPDYGELRTKVAALIQNAKANGSIPGKLYTNPSKEKNTKGPLKDGDRDQVIESIFAYTDYNKGLLKAKESGKPILLYFSAYASTPARRFEVEVLSDTKIQKIINEGFEVILLWVDDRTLLTTDRIYYSKPLKRDVKYLGDIYLEMQLDKFKSSSQPMFFILDKDGKKNASSGTAGVKEFIQFLSKVNM